MPNNIIGHVLIKVGNTIKIFKSRNEQEANELFNYYCDGINPIGRFIGAIENIEIFENNNRG